MANLESSRDVDIDLARLAVAVWERKGRIALMMLLAGVAAFAISSAMSPRYKSEARLLIESRGASYSASEQNNNAAAEGPLLDALNIVSQSQILQSVDLIKRVADDLKLYEIAEFDPDAKPSFFSHLLISLGLKADPHNVPPSERVLEAFRERLMVYQVENSRVIAVQFSSKDPKLAAQIPNAILRTYLDMQSGAKLGTNAEAAKWLEPEIGALREKVRAADQKVAEFRKTADILSVGEGNTFAARQLSDISAELVRLRSEKATADARAANVRQAITNGRPIDNFSDVVGSAMIQRLKENEANIQAQISDLSTSLMDGHPRLRGLRAQLSGIRQQIAEEGRKIVSSLENEARIASLREEELTRQLGEVKADSARAGEQEVQLNELEREAASQRQLLETYLARYREATSRAGSQDSTPADARVISTAIEPRESYFPNVGANTIVAALAALIFSAIVVMLKELFSGRALRASGPYLPGAQQHSEDEGLPEPAAPPAAQPIVLVPVPSVEASAEAPFKQDDHSNLNMAQDEHVVLAEKSPEITSSVHEDLLPAEEQQQTTVIAPTMAPPLDEDYSDFTLEAVSEFISMRGAKPVVLVVSPTGAEGSALTVALARRLADEGRPTVLVDMTVNGEPSRLMTKEQELPGIMDLLVGESAFGDAIHGDRASLAHIIPRGVVKPTGPVKVYDRLAMVVGALSDAYETVLIECGAAQVDSVTRILKHLPAEVILSVPKGEVDLIDGLIESFRASGHIDIMPMILGEQSRVDEDA